MENQVPIRIENFGGHYDRGAEDSVPLDHFIDTLNVKYVDDEAWTRDGLDQVINKANIVRVAIYRRTGEAARYILLDSGGNLYDSSNMVTPILTIASMTDFSCVPFFNRLYITPHNGNKGLAGEYVYVYDGTDCRVAAGAAPTGSLVATLSAEAGYTETGTHLFAIAYETDTGFITAPGPAIFGVVLADGTKKIYLEGIPIGGPNVVARHILATKAIETYNYDQDNYELFYVPDGRINNNTDIATTVDFFDAALVESADYLRENLTNIPAGVGIGAFRARMIIWGEDTYGSYVRISNPGEPESFSDAEGFIAVDVTEAGDVKCCFEFRDSLYMLKSLRTYQTQDNNFTPATWQVTTIDKGCGTEPFGVAMILDAKGANTDCAIIADRSGLLLFTGIYERPELSYKIDALWKRINPNEFHQIQVCNDPIGRNLFILVPLDSNTAPSHILYANYSLGISPDKIRWAVWALTPTPKSIILSVNYSTSKANLNIGSASGVYEMSSAYTNDDGTAIDSYVRHAYADYSGVGALNHYQAIRIHAAGVGSLVPTMYSMDYLTNQVLSSITLGTSPGKEFTVRCNMVTERMSLKLGVSNIDERFQLMRTIIFGKVAWECRPL